MNVPSVTPEELKVEIDSGRSHLLLDVREADELEVSALSGIVHIAMGDVPDRLEEISADADIVVICRSGVRSAKVTQFLLAHGRQRVRNLTDGMNGWSARVDPSVKSY